MVKQLLCSILLGFLLIQMGYTQEDSLKMSARWEGQASAFTLFNPDNNLDFYFGGRYLPAFSWEAQMSRERLVDLEVSANIFGTAGIRPFDSAITSGDIRPYRAWMRFSGPQAELRIGLQKINFGSASILRPLMWFDQIDPRDPLQLTDGVWGMLGRYYFLNNANIWLWGLYGNKNRRGFDFAPTARRTPEFGGRFQFPTPGGEAAVTYHHRTAGISTLGNFEFADTPEHRMGLDGKWDLKIGLWVEATWVHKTRNLGIFTNQNLINVGMDYTFGIGNGVNVIVEQLVLTFDEKAFAFENTFTLSALSASYPLGLFDNLSAITYYDWTNKNLYNTLRWQHSFSAWTLNVLAFWNPKDAQLPQQQFTENLFGGRGLQVLAVFNH